MSQPAHTTGQAGLPPLIDPAEAHETARLVWHRRGAAATTLFLVIAGTAGAAFSPYLLTHAPALLLILSPGPGHVVLAADLLPPAALIGIVVLRRVLGLVAFYWLGRAFGQAAVGYVERRFGRAGRALRWVERGLGRFGAWAVFFVPVPVLCVMSGVARTRVPRTFSAMTMGQLMHVTLTWAFGDAISPWTTPVVEFLEVHVVETTVACAVVVVGWQLSSLVRARRRAAAQAKSPGHGPTGG